MKIKNTYKTEHRFVFQQAPPDGEENIFDAYNKVVDTLTYGPDQKGPDSRKFAVIVNRQGQEQIDHGSEALANAGEIGRAERGRVLAAIRLADKLNSGGFVTDANRAGLEEAFSEIFSTQFTFNRDRKGDEDIVDTAESMPVFRSNESVATVVTYLRDYLPADMDWKAIAGGSKTLQTMVGLA